MKYPELKLIAAVGEGPSERIWLAALARHLLSMAPGELPPEYAEMVETFQRENFLPWKKLPEMEQAMKLTIRRPVGGRDGPKLEQQEHQHFMQFTRIARHKGWLRDGGCLIFFLRDLDGCPERRKTILQAKHLAPADFQATCAVGTPNQCLESWIFLGLGSLKDSPAARKLELGFDPFAKPEMLSHKENVKTSAKDNLERLVGNDSDNWEAAAVAAWESTEVMKHGATWFPEFKAAVQETLEFKFTLMPSSSALRRC